MTRLFSLLFLFLMLASPVQATEPLVFENSTQETRYQELTEELRCLVCQNQNLADSDAPLAQDLRVEIHKMLIAGRSDEETQV